MSDGTTAADANVAFTMEQCEDDVVVVDAVDGANASTMTRSTELAATMMAMVAPRLFLFDEPIMRLF